MTETNNTPAKPRQAATVILARQEDQELQIYLLKRSPKSGFMAGNYVFPGGTVDLEDQDMNFWKSHVDIEPESISSRPSGNLSVEEAFYYGVAAIRETFEEAGVFLAHRKEQAKRDLERLNDMRMTSGLPKGWLRNLVTDEGWTLQLTGLGRWSHWITPELMPRRYDTRFFMVFMPSSQQCIPDLTETIHGIWISPEKGLAGNFKGDIPLSPPTLVTLNELLKFSSLEVLKKEMKTRTWGKALLPRLIASHQEKMIVEPWDPMFNHKVDINTTELEKLVLPPGEPFSRIWFNKGLWQPVGLK